MVSVAEEEAELQQLMSQFEAENPPARQSSFVVDSRGFFAVTRIKPAASPNEASIVSNANLVLFVHQPRR